MPGALPAGTLQGPALPTHRSAHLQALHQGNPGIRFFFFLLFNRRTYVRGLLKMLLKLRLKLFL